MKFLPLAVLALAFSSVAAIGPASAITIEDNSGGDDSNAQRYVDPDEAVENFGAPTTQSGSGTFTIITPQQDGSQFQFGNPGNPGSPPLPLPNFPSGTSTGQ